MMFVYLILASIFGAGLTGAIGYYKGSVACNAAAQSAILRAEVRRLNLSLVYYKSATAATEQINKENTEKEIANAETINKLREEISKPAPTNTCILDADFLRNLSDIR